MDSLLTWKRFTNGEINVGSSAVFGEHIFLLVTRKFTIAHAVISLLSENSRKTNTSLFSVDN